MTGYHSWDRYSTEWENKERDGEWLSENDAPWLMYRMADGGLGWGYGAERKEWFSAGLYSPLLLSLPRFFHVSSQGRPACCPRWCCLSGLPSTGCAPLTPTTTNLYSLNWFQGGKALFLFCFTHTHTHTHTHTRTACQQLVPPVHTHIHAASAVCCQR